MRSALSGLIAGVPLLVSACATAPPADRGLANLLDNGTTTRAAVIDRLGQPYATFDGGKIVTYRLGGNKSKGYVHANAADGGLGWTNATYSLVLIFDDRDILAKHAFVEVR